ncbi:MAG: TetR/AcrR family transcriptional regulator [bacterium]
MKAASKHSGEIIQDTKKYIINTARHLFSEFSYLSVSMSDIARKLNITKAALYYHFTGKAEIYKKVLDEVFDSLGSAISEALDEKVAEKKLYKLIKNYLDFGFKEKNLIKALMLKLSPADSQITNQIAQLRERTLDLIQPVIEEALAGKKLSQKVDSRVFASLLAGMMDGVLLECSLFDKEIDSEKISNQIIAVIL